MKSNLTSTLLIVLLLMSMMSMMSILSGCATPQPTSQRVLNVGMLLAQGGLGDRSFNDSAYAGLQEAQKQHNIRFETADYTSAGDNEETLRNWARQEYDLIIGVGFECVAHIAAVAPEFPERNFAIIDGIVEEQNVASIVYREQEGDFLMGVLAAMLTETDAVGFIGGMDIDIIRRIESGYRQGVAYENRDVAVLAEMADAFTDPEQGKALALAQYEAGADVIYNAAGRTGLGIIEAAKETDHLTIGTSGDQRYLAPDNVVGNRPKRVDTAVLTLIEEVKAGAFTPGARSLGLAEAGLSLGPFNEDLVTDEMRQRLNDLQEKIITGEIIVNVPTE